MKINPLRYSIFIPVICGILIVASKFFILKIVFKDAGFELLFIIQPLNDVFYFLIKVIIFLSTITLFKHNRVIKLIALVGNAVIFSLYYYNVDYIINMFDYQGLMYIHLSMLLLLFFSLLHRRDQTIIDQTIKFLALIIFAIYSLYHILDFRDNTFFIIYCVSAILTVGLTIFFIRKKEILHSLVFYGITQTGVFFNLSPAMFDYFG